ncbi:MAG: LysM peptidoglycan-binding domain-containing protein, partial [Alphaproteobacteria bacterium]
MLLSLRQAYIGPLFPRLLIVVFVATIAVGCEQGSETSQSWRQKLAQAPQRSWVSLAPDARAWRAPLEVEPLAHSPGGSAMGNATLQPEHRWGNMLHRMRRGDTLYHLARSYYGDAKYWRLILAENRETISTPRHL